ncbi:Bctms1 [Botrytis cinerea B05.10]|uniref:Bctms1 n=3 Tax=Botryotinia fuckeliana TaxID=40559 RepID=A0A384K4S8_BOTFB|nr:Bctms1 [Botrytis cinerea B05.10]ATZ57835.1 Bctms1 [Botrytis cinerea B05.10]EMR82057.1 putative serine incorporator protein [Botrytis cinerea BcDW1]CCD47151.1 similar to membrane protein TMS1 [Botrytis cinerea T4]
MGALLSIPLLAVPSMGTVMGFAASCCGAATCSAVCSACGKCGNSVATRIAYALILLINSILSWIMLTPWAINKLQGLTLDYMKISCPEGECYGWVAVHRINFALGIFHLIMASMLLGVNSSKNPRAAIQNGFWGPKIIAWLGLIVLSFLIPDGFFLVWGNYIAFTGSTLFLLLGLILLVDLAHTWAEYCLEQIEAYDSRAWRGILIGSTLGMYACSLAMTIVQYIFFAGAGCSMNQTAITLNLIFLIVVSVVSVHPMVQEFNPRAGLAQSAMVAIYCTYLTMSAVSMEPDTKHCNPLIRAQGTRTTSIIIGAIVTMLTVAYTTTRAATQGVALGGKGKRIALPEDDEHDLVTQQPDSRREMRAAALRQAVEEGSLPADALLDDDDESDSGNTAKDDERTSTQYSYALFHVIFFLATTWVATLLTMNMDEYTDGNTSFAPVGRTYWASWVKIISSWVCYGIYTWTLVAPVVLPDRFDF